MYILASMERSFKFSLNYKRLFLTHLKEKGIFNKSFGLYFCFDFLNVAMSEKSVLKYCSNANF